jgi:hypothetical protein
MTIIQRPLSVPPITDSYSNLEKNIISAIRQIDKSCRQCTVVINRNSDGTYQVFIAKPSARVSPDNPMPPCCAGG